VLEKCERGKRIIESIVPISIRGVFGKVGESEGKAEITQRMRLFIGPGGTGELEGVDPRAEGVAGEGAEEAFFGAVTVGHDGAASEVAFKNGPEGEEGRGLAQVIGRDPVDLAGGPSDVLLALEEGNKRRVDVVSGGPGPQADLNRSIGAAFGRASGLEVDGGESCLADLDKEELADEQGNRNLISWGSESF